MTVAPRSRGRRRLLGRAGPPGRGGSGRSTSAGVRAVDGADLSAEPGAIVGLIGPNGSGKTTMLDVISGLVTPGGGLGAPRRGEPGRVPARGAVLAGPRALLPGLPALPGALGGGRADADPGRPPTGGRGLLDPAAARGPAGPSGPSGRRWTGSSPPSASSGSAGTASPSSRPGPGGWSTWPPWSWPEPRLLLLDEPTAGIAQREAEAFVPLLRRLHQLADTTIVLVEHDVPLVFALCTKVVMMESGSVVSSGTPDEVERDPRALAAYLGASEEALAVSGAIPGSDPVRIERSGRRHGTHRGRSRTTVGRPRRAASESQGPRFGSAPGHGRPEGHVAPQGDPVGDPGGVPVVVEGVVEGGPVVPEGDRSRPPAEPAGQLGLQRSAGRAGRGSRRSRAWTARGWTG